MREFDRNNVVCGGAGHRVWNEAPCDATYVKQLRQSLDAAGFADTQIVAQDGGTRKKAVSFPSVTV